MKLSELLGFLNILNDLNIETNCGAALNTLKNVDYTVSNFPLKIENTADDLNKDVVKVEGAVRDFQNTLAYLKTRIENTMRAVEPRYYQESRRLYEQEMCWETTEYILGRTLSIDSETRELISGRLRGYGDWRLPGMILRPGRESFIEEMVPLDPLYLVDQNLDLLTPSVGKFTTEYQQRLRQYAINDYVDDKILWQLPNDQFGFIFAFNFLNYKPIDVLQRYLTEFYEKLRPGGVALFTYNNCDIPQGMGLAEASFMCFTPGKRVKEIAEQIGFDIILDKVGPYDLSMLELKKPGEIRSIRGGQTLAKIIPN